MNDFFEEGSTYSSPVGRFECKCVLEEHGRRYAFGLSYSKFVPDDRGIPTTYRIQDYPGNFTKVVA